MTGLNRNAAEYALVTVYRNFTAVADELTLFG